MTPLVARFRKLNDQDCVLRAEADEDDESYLSVDVVLEAPRCHGGKGAEDSDRRAQKHAERQGPALILRSEDEKDAEERKAEYSEGGDAFPRLLFLKAHADTIDPHLWRHRLPEHFLQGLHHLA